MMKFKIKVVFTSTPQYCSSSGVQSTNYTGCIGYQYVSYPVSIPTGKSLWSASYQLLNEKDEILGTFYSRNTAKEVAKHIASKDNNVEEFKV